MLFLIQVQLLQDLRSLERINASLLKSYLIKPSHLVFRERGIENLSHLVDRRLNFAGKQIKLLVVGTSDYGFVISSLSNEVAQFL